MDNHTLKKELKVLLLTKLKEQLLQANQNHESTVQAAFHEEAKSEHDKDMRSTELSYLARGYAQRIEEIDHGINLVKQMPAESIPTRTIRASSLIMLESTQQHQTKKEICFLAPFGAGLHLDVATNKLPFEDLKSERESVQRVQVVTPLSPLGKSLMGKSPQDSFEIQVAQSTIECSILDVI